jgi:hypothetical protein
LIGVLILTLALVFLRIDGSHGVAQYPFPRSADRLLEPFGADGPPSAADYDGLFLYFVLGFETFRKAGGVGAKFPGLRSEHGDTADRIEGFSRMAPLWGAWVHSGRNPRVALPIGRSADLVEVFRRGLLGGTSGESSEYWGDIQNHDQRICEAADIALATWLYRDTVWQAFRPAEREQVAGWLRQVNGKEIVDNNWHLFITFINVVLEKLGMKSDLRLARQHYGRLKDFYVGDGWFSDGPQPRFDYYNAWAIHYLLYWLQDVDPAWDRAFLTAAHDTFLFRYKYLLTPAGIPILGRSVCYRAAAPAPMIFAQRTGDGAVTPAEARRALDVTWQYFIRHGGVRNGNMSQGYHGVDARVLDNYSGPASCLWSLRSLVAAFHQPSDSDFWNKPAGRLQVENADFSFTIDSIGWTVFGNRANGNVEIYVRGNADNPVMQDFTIWSQFKTLITGSPHRPDNLQAKYARLSYSSRIPFCGCAQAAPKG